MKMEFVNDSKFFFQLFLFALRSGISFHDACDIFDFNLEAFCEYRNGMS